jgi:hypothetical protein
MSAPSNGPGRPLAPRSGAPRPQGPRPQGARPHGARALWGVVVLVPVLVGLALAAFA